MFRIPVLLLLFLVGPLVGGAEDAPDKNLTDAGDRLNRLGVALFSASCQVRAGNLAISPWPTHRSLSLAFLGARGDTRTEIATALGSLDPVADEAILRGKIGENIKQWNTAMDSVANGRNRVSAMEWNDLSAAWVTHLGGGRAEYLEAVKKIPGTRVSAIDFSNPGKAQVEVNEWIATATKNRVPRLLPPNAFTLNTRFALSSMLYLKAPWKWQFQPEQTRHEPFNFPGKNAERVPTMIGNLSVRSAVYEGFTALGVQTNGFGQETLFQLLILLPDEGKSVSTIEAKVDPEFLRQCADMQSSGIELHLPRFRIPALTMALKKPLGGLGIRAAFDQSGVADFKAMADAPLYLDEIYDACEFSIDENGLSGSGAVVTEAAVLGKIGEPLPAKTVVRVNRPFLFALQHVPSGACLFLGRVTDPR